MQRGTKGAVIGGVIAVVAAGAVYTVYQGTGSAGETVRLGRVLSGPLSGAEVRSGSEAFLAAWQSGDSAKAAALTDDSTQAGSQLGAFQKDFHATSMKITATRPASGDQVSYALTAGFDYAGHRSTWSYHAALTMVRDPQTGDPVVHWEPSTVYPGLTHGQTLAAVTTAPPPLTVLDRRGTPLSATAYPSLAGILDQLRTRYGTKLKGSASMAIGIRNANGSTAKVLHPLATGTAGKSLPTTIDPALQAEAEVAVTKQGPDASVVVVQPSTGDILAVADNPAAGYDKAMLGQYASGSTFKVITASTLLSTGSYTPNSPLACPTTITYGGRTFHNVEGESFKNATTVATDFAASCNTAFISTAAVLPDGAVEAEAKDVFGLGLTWNTGVASWDGKVPAGTGALKASTYIGQGEVQVNPLNMASVAATAESGMFRQPVLVPVSVDHRTIAQAPRQLSAAVDSDIRSMMALTARSGTAAPTIGGLSGDVGAKTGTAEVDGQTKPNSWFIAYRGDVAAAAVVPNTGDGYKYAGKIVTAILSVS